MKKIFGIKIRIVCFMLALLIASIACTFPDVVKLVGEDLKEGCSTVDRSRYEDAAEQLGVIPERPKYPESAVYEVCYTEKDLTSVRMSEGYRADEEKIIPTGSYIGQSDFKSTLDNDVDDSFLEPICTQNTIEVVIGSDGTAEGELRSICYANSAYPSEEGQSAMHSDVTGIIRGEITDISGQLIIEYTWHSYSTGPQCTSETPCRDNTRSFEFLYNINVVNKVMKFSPAGEVEEYYYFELVMQ